MNDLLRVDDLLDDEPPNEEDQIPVGQSIPDSSMDKNSKSQPASFREED